MFVRCAVPVDGGGGTGLRVRGLGLVDRARLGDDMRRRETTTDSVACMARRMSSALCSGLGWNVIGFVLGGTWTCGRQATRASQQSDERPSVSAAPENCSMRACSVSTTPCLARWLRPVSVRPVQAEGVGKGVSE